jgi:UDP-GlcNAc:undecaprenyl-phosphate GlcNAc-1-phosphate transferase
MLIENESHYIPVSMISALVTLVVILAARLIAPRLGLVDTPCGRKKHFGSIPIVGGIGIYAALCTSIFLSVPWSSNLGQIILWVGIIFIIGLFDDRIPIGWKFRFAAQIISTLGVIWSTGMAINTIGSYPFIGEITLKWVAWPLTLIFIIGLTNAFNFIDGLDGLCASLAIIAVIGLWVLGAEYNLDYQNILLSLFLSLGVFLVFNLILPKSQKVFLGDSGSSTIGFIIGWLLVLQLDGGVVHISPPTVLWIVFVPVIDAFRVILFRLLNGKNIFHPDRTHIHHLLLEKGLSPIVSLFIILALGIITMVIGVYLQSEKDAISIGYISIFLLVYIFMLKRKK